MAQREEDGRRQCGLLKTCGVVTLSKSSSDCGAVLHDPFVLGLSPPYSWTHPSVVVLIVRIFVCLFFVYRDAQVCFRGSRLGLWCILPLVVPPSPFRRSPSRSSALKPFVTCIDELFLQPGRSYNSALISLVHLYSLSSISLQYLHQNY